MWDAQALTHMGKALVLNNVLISSTTTRAVPETGTVPAPVTYKMKYLDLSMKDPPWIHN